MLSRRGVLLAGVAGAGIGLGAGVSLTSRGERDPDEEAIVARVEPGPVVRGTFNSQARGGVATRWSLIRPPQVSGALPLVLALHGHGGSTEALLDERWDLPGALARAVETDGVSPFALATVSGGTSFWHERPWGEDAGAMVVDELLPILLARPDIAVGPIGLLGWSMGGYGVLRLAGILGPDRVGAVVASSPGLYADPALAHPDGFVDAAEYERFSVMDRQGDLAGIPVHIDIGTADPFYDATRTYVEGFPADADVSATFNEGGHEISYSQRMLASELAFLAARVG